MKVCFPTDTDQQLQAPLADHFGTAAFFTVIDLDSGAVRVRSNPACHAHPGGCHHVELLRSERVDAVVSRGLGRNALAALQQAGIQVLMPTGPQVGDSLHALRTGAARQFSLNAACCGHGGGCGHGHHPGHHHGADDTTREPQG